MTTYKGKVRLGYKAAIQWIVDNDDIDFIHDDDPSPSVTAVFCADMYDQDVDKVVYDIRKYAGKVTT